MKPTTSAQPSPIRIQATQKNHEVYFTSTNTGGGLIDSEQTCCFPHTSNISNKYLAIFYVYDVNALLSVPIKSRAKEELLRSYKKIYSYLEARGFKPKLHKLDNETSTDVKEFITAQQAKYQYTPPGMHWSNAADKDVQTYKNHLTAGIASLPDDFPIAFWDRLTPQGDWSLN